MYAYFLTIRYIRKMNRIIFIYNIVLLTSYASKSFCYSIFPFRGYVEIYRLTVFLCIACGKRQQKQCDECY